MGLVILTFGEHAEMSISGSEALLIAPRREFHKKLYAAISYLEQ